MKPTTLARILIEKCLDDPVLIDQLQNEHAVHTAYRVIPVTVKGEIEYVLNDGR